uniref:Uncharacterized protein n=1 Tax=Romanomermis culicivorax TaxID=13658 RepID=A0A915K299_ROMCU
MDNIFHAAFDVFLKELMIKMIKIRMRKPMTNINNARFWITRLIIRLSTRLLSDKSSSVILISTKGILNEIFRARAIQQDSTQIWESVTSTSICRFAKAGISKEHLDDEPQVGAVLTAILDQYRDRFGTTNIDFNLNDYFTFDNELVT